MHFILSHDHRCFDALGHFDNKDLKTLKYFKCIHYKSHEVIDNLIENKSSTKVISNFRSKIDGVISKSRNSNRPQPTNLTVELIRDPDYNVEIYDLRPEFGWNVPLESKFQKGYQILVSSSKSMINQNIGDVWDSEYVASKESVNVEYKGTPLKVGKTYYWKVRIWDEENRMSDYSEPQKFITGKSYNYIVSTENKFEVDRVKPIEFENRGDFYFMDFGKAAFATIEFIYKANKPHVITIRIGEELDGENINRKPFEKSHIRFQEVKMRVNPRQTKYQLKIVPDKRNTLEGKAIPLPEGFPVLMPFRYAEIEGVQGFIKADDFEQLRYRTYWEEDTSYFNSDNQILNQVWDLCKYSIKATTFNGLYVDGDRERIPYEADAYLNQLSHYATDREYAMARRTIEYLMEHPTWPTEWQQHMALMIYADYMYTGNTELISRYYEKLKHKSLYELSNDEGLITSTKITKEFMYKLGFKSNYDKPLTDIVDWPPAGWGNDPNSIGERDGFVFKPYNTVVNAFFYENMKIMSKLAQILGKTQEALDFELRATKVKKAINHYMFDKERGVYVDGIGTSHASLHANMIPLAFKLVPEEYLDSVVSFVKSRGMACSVYGSQYLLDGLYNTGEQDYALELLTSTSDRSWYNMIRIGSTITLEAWDFKYKNNLDWNHAWGAVPANIITRGLWGIKPKIPGFEIATINPQLGKLKFSNIKVPTVRGTIKGNYSYNDSNEAQTYSIEIPGNMIAEFSINGREGKDILHNGKKVPVHLDCIVLDPGKHIIKVNSALNER